MSISDPKVTTVAQVDVQSAWASKINWTQAVAILASALVFMTGGKVNIPLDVQVQIVTGITVAQGLITWVMKTWFTKTITPSSAAAPDVPTKDVVK
jgi:hypothetical protein